MPIYAFEGPSGSGKDYQMAMIRNEGLFNGIQLDRPALPRCLDNWMGAWSSSFMEYEAIAAATMSNKEVICNRFLMSRWIYRAMQFNGNKLTLNWYEEMNRSFRRLKTMAVAEAWDRIGQAIYLHPTVEITVLIPSLHKLEEQRSQTGKLYPFSGLIESKLYEEMAHRLIEDPIGGILVAIDRS